MTLRHHVYRILEPDDALTLSERVGDIVMGALIFANVVAAIAASVPGVEEAYGPALGWFEGISVVLFTIEYGLRIWTSVEEKGFAHPITGRLRFLLSPMALLDLAVLVAAYLPAVSFDLRFIRVLRLVRLMRVLKLVRYSSSLKMFLDVFNDKRADLGVVLVFLSVMVVLASSLMFIAERHVQPDVFSSIPAAMWWSIVTLTTVGYGDIYPVSMPGRLLGAVIAVMGIGFFALPAGLLASGFAEAIAKRGQAPGACPHCGRGSEETTGSDE
jgi:voltage-gated potassium channel